LYGRLNRFTRGNEENHSMVSRYAFMVTCALGMLIALPEHALGQRSLNLDQFESCRACRLTVTPMVRLTPRAPAVIETEHAWVVHDPARREYLMVAGPTTVAVFDEQGRYLRSFGRRGRGPGELEFIRDLRTANGRIIILDGVQRRWWIGTAAGSGNTSGRIEIGALEFLPIAGDTVVVAGIGMYPSSVGYPLHLGLLSTGDQILHFGSQTGEFNAQIPWAQRVLVAPSVQPRNVWVATPRQLRFEEWSVSGELVRVVYGTPTWFPIVRRIPEFGTAPPPTRLRQFLVDASNRLWVLSWVPASDWRRAAERARRTPDGEVLIDTEEYFATRLDVFDLSNRFHVGTVRIENDKVRILDRRGDVLIQQLEYDTALEPRIVLYRVQIDSATRR
jgi:hypothetical protein